MSIPTPNIGELFSRKIHIGFIINTLRPQTIFDEPAFTAFVFTLEIAFDGGVLLAVGCFAIGEFDQFPCGVGIIWGVFTIDGRRAVFGMANALVFLPLHRDRVAVFLEVGDCFGKFAWVFFHH